MAGNASGVAKAVFNFFQDPTVREVITVGVPLVKTILAWYNGPSQPNQTVREIEAWYREQAAERERQRIREIEALEQQRAEEERARNESAREQGIIDEGIRIQAEQRDARVRAENEEIERPERDRLRLENMRIKTEEDEAKRRAEVAEKSRIEMTRIVAERNARVRAENEEIARVERDRLRLENMSIKTEEDEARRRAAAAEKSRIEMTTILTEATEQVCATNSATRRTEARRIRSLRDMEDKRRTEARRIRLVKDMEDRREDEKAGQRSYQSEQWKRAEDKRQLAEAVNEAEETRRAEEELRRAEETRKAEEESRRAEKETRKAEEETRRAEEETREAENEKRRIEVARKVAEAKRAEDERRSAEVANEKRKIDAANNLQAAKAVKEATPQRVLEVIELQHRSEEARRQNNRKDRLSLYPNQPEFEAAKKRIHFDPDKFRFAIAGCAGTGKSSLINIFLNLLPKDKNGARIGTKETTREITRYPDPADMPPRKWIDWYDVPGGGTSNIPISGYFNNQCLFLMDIILVLVGDRLTELDLEILRRCRAFEIPSMIVRSRSDLLIENMVMLRAEELDIPRDDALNIECRIEYIAETRDNIAAQLQEHGLPPQYVYLVCCSPFKPFQKAYSSFAGGAPYSGAPHFIDEMKLIHDLTIAANERRSGGTREQGESTRLDMAPESPTGEGNSAGTGTDSTDKSQIAEELQDARVKNDATPRVGVNQYEWGRQPETAGSPPSSRKYIIPGQRFLALSSNRSEIVSSNSSRESIPNNEPAATPVQVAIVKITVAFARCRPVSLSAEILADIDINVHGAQLLVLSLTRSLAIHTHGVLQTFATPLNLRSVVCAGGGKVPKRWQHIVSGTPARVGNLIERGSLQMENIRTLILNMEPDIPQDIHQQIYDVYRHLPPGVKILRGTLELDSTGQGLQ